MKANSLLDSHHLKEDLPHWGKNIFFACHHSLQSKTSTAQLLSLSMKLSDLPVELLLKVLPIEDNLMCFPEHIIFHWLNLLPQTELFKRVAKAVHHRENNEFVGAFLFEKNCCNQAEVEERESLVKLHSRFEEKLYINPGYSVGSQFYKSSLTLASKWLSNWLTYSKPLSELFCGFRETTGRTSANVCWHQTFYLKVPFYSRVCTLHTHPMLTLSSMTRKNTAHTWWKLFRCGLAEKTWSQPGRFLGSGVLSCVCRLRNLSKWKANTCNIRYQELIHPRLKFTYLHKLWRRHASERGHKSRWTKK